MLLLSHWRKHQYRGPPAQCWRLRSGLRKRPEQKSTRKLPVPSQCPLSPQTECLEHRLPEGSRLGVSLENFLQHKSKIYKVTTEFCCTNGFLQPQKYCFIYFVKLLVVLLLGLDKIRRIFQTCCLDSEAIATRGKHFPSVLFITTLFSLTMHGITQNVQDETR